MTLTQSPAATAHFVELAPRATAWQLTTGEGGECYLNSTKELPENFFPGQSLYTLLMP